MKFALNGALTIGTLDGANIEIKDHVGDDNIVIFGLTADEVAAKRADGYDPRDVDRGVARTGAGAVRRSRSGVFSPDDPDRYAELIGGLYDHDWFMVAADFDAYAAAQREVDARWDDRAGWRAARSATSPTSAGSPPTAPSANMPATSGASCEAAARRHRSPARRASRRSLLAARRPCTGPSGTFARAWLPGAETRRGARRSPAQRWASSSAIDDARPVRRRGRRARRSRCATARTAGGARMVGDRSLQLRPGARPDRRPADRARARTAGCSTSWART